MSASSRISYRADVDGLRAIAVLAVILFHAGLRGFAGGYIGVDVFFVISGYLITRLLRESPGGSLRQQLTTFYLRRARRILPALLCMLTVCTVVAAWLFFAFDRMRFGRSLIFAIAMLGNVGSWLTGGYFDLHGKFTPLEHLWSIGVEEQFYIFYPVVLIALYRWTPHRFAIAIAAALVASLVLCVWAAAQKPIANYYALPTRVWELLMGAALALGLLPRIRNPIGLEFAAVTALLAIISTIALFDASTPYPSLITTAPALATVVLIASGEDRRTLVAAFLASRPLVFTGLISYSLYLWHAPLLAFFSYYQIGEPSTAQKIVLLAAIYLVAAFTWWTIEQPIRLRKVLVSNSKFLATAVVGSAVLFVTGLLLWRYDGFPRFDAARARAYLEPAEDQTRDALRCMTLTNEAIAAGRVCAFAPGADPVNAIFVWGDSHALSLLPAYRNLARSHAMTLYFAGRSSCRPLIGVQLEKRYALGQDACAAFNAAVARSIAVLDPSVVVLNAFWDHPGRVLADTRPNGAATSMFRSGLEATLRQVAAHRSICVVLDPPLLDSPLPYALAMAERRTIDRDFLRVTRSAALMQFKGVEDDIRLLEARGLIRIADPKERLCSGLKCAIVGESGVPLYSDSNHLSTIGAYFVQSALEACFESAPTRTTLVPDHSLTSMQ